MFELKRLHHESVGAALKKAEHYRLLNQPRQAESICLDVLACEPENQPALILLLLARTDQFGRSAGCGIDEARQLLPQITGEYERTYYAGIICERWGKAALANERPRSGEVAYDWMRQAMEWYEKAETLREEGNDDPLLRWNACARLIMRHRHVRSAEDEDFHPLLE